MISMLGVSLSQVIQLFKSKGGDFEADCRSPSLPIPELKRIRDFYVTAFFQRHLLPDRAYDEFLTSDYAAQHEPGVVFQRKEIGQP